MTYTERQFLTRTITNFLEMEKVDRPEALRWIKDTFDYHYGSERKTLIEKVMKVVEEDNTL